jgi:anti-sigma factor RsiW
MNINRHNYEELFLLYIDNELSPEDRKAVEIFVRQNPDLAGELALLQHTTLEPQPSYFQKKESLLKEELPLPVDQGRLLLLLDEELNAVDRAGLEEQLGSDIRLQKEWALLQSTKLDPREPIVFENKESLYRYSAKRVPFRWWKVAAAAILLGLGTWLGISYMNPGKVQDTHTAAAVSEKQSPDAPVTGDNTAAKTKPDANSNATVPAPVNTKSQTHPAIVTDPETGKQEKPFHQPAATDKNLAANEKISGNKPTDDLPKPPYENSNKQPRNETWVANVPVIKEPNRMSGTIIDNAVTRVKPDNNKEPLPVPGTGNNAVAGASYASLTDDVTGMALNTPDEKSNDRYLYMNDDQVKHNKLGGLFRKVKRMLERNANIKTGNGIKIAGFEIASR